MQNKLVIQGVTEDGKKFRPSDWAERICGNLCTFRNRRMYYSPLLRPAVIDGIKCMIVDPTLSDSHPELYLEITAFAEKNKLVTKSPV